MRIHNVIVSSRIRIFLNNKLTDPEEINRIFQSIQVKKILEEKGGFLFKSSINDSEFHISIIPVIMDGQRTHHYDIRLDYEDEYILSGFFNIDGSLGMLFTPPGRKDRIEQNFKNRLKNCYRETAIVLLENGFPPDIKLDWVSQKILGEIGIFQTIPRTLSDVLL
jgi:hypothetical protein